MWSRIAVFAYDPGLGELIRTIYKPCTIVHTVWDLLLQVQEGAQGILVSDRWYNYQDIPLDIKVLALSGTPKPSWVTQGQFQVFETNTFLSVMKQILNPS
jgi:hypothetical protein